ncbi:hypothetical protein [[Phormidium] sp. ETS-05]|uniref:hypothetical protein n=1 Tax=[Phormidium] sp. ETS-05 TaxID=222819 RepID=UPI0018EF0CE3|nr:hypothetical protein [[Phormidium] sp. ETS-05]
MPVILWVILDDRAPVISVSCVLVRVRSASLGLGGLLGRGTGGPFGTGGRGDFWTGSKGDGGTGGLGDSETAPLHPC